MYYRVVGNGECYGAGSLAECEAIREMHKSSVTGHNKPSRISAMTLDIERMEGEYPRTLSPAKLGYKPGVSGLLR